MILPMAALACAHECHPPQERTATTGEHSGHCQEPATDSTSIVTNVDGSCALGALADVAARNRTTTVIDSASVAARPAAITLVTASKTFAPHFSRIVGRLGGTRPGAILPLRI
jgi:hypothetical protein